METVVLIILEQPDRHGWAKTNANSLSMAVLCIELYDADKRGGAVQTKSVMLFH